MNVTLSKKTNNRTTENTKLAFLMLGLTFILSIIEVGLVISATIPYKDSVKGLFNSFCVPQDMAISTSITILGKNRLDNDSVDVLAYSNQFNEETILNVKQSIADQLTSNQLYNATRITHTGFTGSQEVRYEFIVNNEYSGQKIPELERLSTDLIESEILELRFDDSHASSGGITQYFITVSFNDNGLEQVITNEITEDLYNKLEGSSTAVISKAIYEVSSTNHIINYKVAEDD